MYSKSPLRAEPFLTETTPNRIVAFMLILSVLLRSDCQLRINEWNPPLWAPGANLNEMQPFRCLRQPILCNHLSMDQRDRSNDKERKPKRVSLILPQQWRTPQFAARCTSFLVADPGFLLARLLLPNFSGALEEAQPTSRDFQNIAIVGKHGQLAFAPFVTSPCLRNPPKYRLILVRKPISTLRTRSACIFKTSTLVELAVWPLAFEGLN